MKVFHLYELTDDIKFIATVLANGRKYEFKYNPETNYYDAYDEKGVVAFSVANDKNLFIVPNEVKQYNSIESDEAFAQHFSTIFGFAGKSYLYFIAKNLLRTFNNTGKITLPKEELSAAIEFKYYLDRAIKFFDSKRSNGDPDYQDFKLEYIAQNILTNTEKIIENEDFTYDDPEILVEMTMAICLVAIGGLGLLAAKYGFDGTLLLDKDACDKVVDDILQAVSKDSEDGSVLKISNTAFIASKLCHCYYESGYDISESYFKPIFKIGKIFEEADQKDLYASLDLEALTQENIGGDNKYTFESLITPINIVDSPKEFISYVKDSSVSNLLHLTLPICEYYTGSMKNKPLCCIVDTEKATPEKCDIMYHEFTDTVGKVIPKYGSVSYFYKVVCFAIAFKLLSEKYESGKTHNEMKLGLYQADAILAACYKTWCVDSTPIFSDVYTKSVLMAEKSVLGVKNIVELMTVLRMYYTDDENELSNLRTKLISIHYSSDVSELFANDIETSDDVGTALKIAKEEIPFSSTVVAASLNKDSGILKYLKIKSEMEYNDEIVKIGKEYCDEIPEYATFYNALYTNILASGIEKFAKKVDEKDFSDCVIKLFFRYLGVMKVVDFVMQYRTMSSADFLTEKAKLNALLPEVHNSRNGRSFTFLD